VLFTQYYLGCLSQASYLIGDETTGRAAVIDPRRDVAEYLSGAAAAGLRIALAATAHPSRPACRGRAGSPTCPTSSAATRGGV